MLFAASIGAADPSPVALSPIMSDEADRKSLLNPTSAIRGLKQHKLLILLGWSIVGLHHKQKEIRRFSSYQR
jgi:hypothetical protein